MHWDTFKQDNYSIVGGDGGSRASEVQAGTTSPMPNYKDFSTYRHDTVIHNVKFITEFSSIHHAWCGDRHYIIITMSLLYSSQLVPALV